MIGKKISITILYILPIFVMIGLIALVQNDYVLTGIYVLCIGLLILTKREKHDLLALMVGVVVITISEYFFVSTGVEVFLRQSLFGMMPLWLPLLWGYAFVTTKRVLRILDR